MVRSKNINHYNQVTKALTICLCGLLGIVSLSAAVLSSIKVNADGDTYSVTDTISATVPTACTMSGSGEESHTASLMPGTYSASSGSPYENGIGSTTLTTYCNDSEGFAIYAIGYTNDTLGNTNLIGALSSHPTIATGTATTGNTSNWAMKVNKVTDPTTSYMPAYMYIDGSFDTNYKAVPSTYTRVAHYQATAGTPSSTDATLGAKVTTTYAAYVAPAQIADTYTGQVKYIMVHPNSFVAGTYTIAYNANGGTGTMTSEIGLLNYEEHTLKANTFTAPSGKVFSGWCTTNTSQSECASGTFYSPGGTVPPSTVASGTTLNLYAIWGDLKTIANSTYMQEVEACPSTLTTNQVYQIKDKRDEQAYNVAKLADGKCWMVENLNLPGGTALSADDTDVTSAYVSSFSTSKNLTKSGSTIVLPVSSTSGFSTANYSYVYNSGNKESCGASGQDTPCYSYYSWDAATLGSGRSIAADNENAPYSICPKGWKLPSTYNGTNSTTDFRALMIALGGSDSVQTYDSSTTPTGATMYGLIGPGTTPSFLLAGLYSNGSFQSGGSIGVYWSSTSSSNTNNARFLSLGSSLVYSARGANRYIGYSVRCLLDS